MAQDSDQGQRTEEPSQRKLLHARDQGQVAQSREINTWFMLATSGIVLIFMAPSICRTLVGVLAGFTEPARFLDGGGILWGAVRASLDQIAVALVAPFVLFVLAAIASSVVQTGFVFAVDKLGFDLSRLSPVSGFGRLMSLRSLIEMCKSLAKMVVVAAVAALLLRSELDRMPLLGGIVAEDIMGAIERLVLRLLFGILMVLTVLASVDYFYQRLHHLHSLRMSKREVRDEMKQAEGDPVVKARLRQIRTERARRRMMAAVPGASVVIANPTHFAVALKYEMGAAGAPRVVAKGADLIALRIREIATENKVPVVENPPLARALFAAVELDREIPPEHYKAVAEIISYVFRLKGKLPARAAAV